MRVHGGWYEGASARRQEAVLEIQSGVATLWLAQRPHFTLPIANITPSSRLAGVERRIEVLGTGVFTTEDNDGIDAAFGGGSVHRMESSLRWVVSGLAATLLFVYLVVVFGIPWMSTKIAYMLPEEANTLIAKQTREFLDGYLLSPSQLSEAKRSRIRQAFEAQLLAKLPGQQSYRLEFRHWEMGDKAVPNALALPSGELIVTDALVKLCRSDNELFAVLLHEIGHVRKRHSLRMLIESSFISLAVTVLIGDVSSWGDLGVGLGTLLVNSRYSRSHESEADRYAFESMLQMGIDPILFSDIMGRMEHFMQQQGEKEQHRQEIGDYFASHPQTDARRTEAERYSRCFHKGLRSCPATIE